MEHLDTGGAEVEPSLVGDFAVIGVDQEEGLLAHDDDFAHLRVLVLVRYHVESLLSNISDPIRLHLILPSYTVEQ